MKHLLPEGWPKPSGYSNGILVDGQQLHVAGLIGWDSRGKFAGGFVAQFEQVLRNTVDVLQAGGAGPEHIVRMTWFVTDLDAYRENLGDIGRVYRDLIGKNFPVMAVVEVNGLVEREAMIEIETTAVLPR